MVVSDVESSFGQDQVKLLFSDATKKVVDLAKVGGESQSLTVGSLYTYDTNKDGEYTLTTASVVGTGFDKAANNGQVKAQSSSSSKAGYIDNYAIADDAVIFVKYNTNDYKGHLRCNHEDDDGNSVHCGELLPGHRQFQHRCRRRQYGVCYF